MLKIWNLNKVIDQAKLPICYLYIIVVHYVCANLLISFNSTMEFLGHLTAKEEAGAVRLGETNVFPSM